MDKRAKLQGAAAVVGLLVALGIFYVTWRGRVAGPQAYFYDLSKRTLFVASANLIPPIRGIDNDEEDGVKAVVIQDSAEDRKSRRIAYLERYAPELKKDMEEARAKNAAPMISRAASQSLRFVRREKEEAWHSLFSEEGQRIVSEWTAPGANGLSPVVCSP